MFTLEPENVDFHRDVLYVKRTKNDEDREVPMNDVSRELLSELVLRATRNRITLTFSLTL